MSESKRETCAAVTEHLVAYVDGELAGAELETVEAHVVTCLPCRQEIESIEKVGQLVGTLPRIEPSADLQGRLQRRVEAPPTAVRSQPARTPAWGVAFAAAAAVALAIGSVLNQGAVPRALLSSVGVVEAPVEAVREPPVPAGVAPRRAVTEARYETARTAAAGAFDELMPEDLPPDLLARPELYLRLPVVRRLETLEHFEALQSRADRDRVG